MFSDSRAPVSGEQKGFKPHTPHFIPWLRNTLKPHHNPDLGLNGPQKPNPDELNSLAPCERTKGIGIFSIQGKDKSKKAELRCNGMGMARMLPMVLRGHHILPGSLGKQREESQAGRSKPDPASRTRSPDDDDKHTVAGRQIGTPSIGHPHPDGTGKYGPLVGPPAVPETSALAEEPAVVRAEGERGKVWDYTSHTIHQRDLHSSSWLSSNTQGLIDGQHGFRSSFSYISRNSQSQRDLTATREPPVEGFNSPLNGLIFSTEIPPRGPDFSTTLVGPAKLRPSSKPIPILGQNMTWVQPGPNGEGRLARKEAGCSRKVVRNQIKRVVDNLEQVVAALRDVHQEMKEVVQQIDYLTSSLDLNEEQQRTVGGENSNSTYGSCSGVVKAGIARQRPSVPDVRPGTSGTLRRDRRTRSRSPPNTLLCPVPSGFSEQSQTLQLSCAFTCSPRQRGPSLCSGHLAASAPSARSNNQPQVQTHTVQDITLSPKRSIPVRPPTPGLSPLTVNLHPPSSPSSQPHSPGVCSSIVISPASPLSPNRCQQDSHSPSVVTETSQSDHPFTSPPNPPLIRHPSASCPPADSETQTVPSAEGGRRSSSAGPIQRPSQVRSDPGATVKAPAARSRRGRKPPPYPHHKLSETTNTIKPPRKAPPYPEKRRLLSTTV